MSKATGRHPDKALTTVQVRALKNPGRYADGNGLYLVVERTGSKRWLLRTVVHGRRRDIGLGGASLVTLAEVIRPHESGPPFGMAFEPGGRIDVEEATQA